MAASRRWGIMDRLPSGRYRARYTGPDGKRHAAPGTFDTKGQADHWLALRRAEIATGTWEPPEVVEARRRATEAAAQAKEVTLREYGERWIDQRTTKSGAKLSRKTVYDHRLFLRGRLTSLVDLTLGDITPALVRAWRAEQLERGTRTQTARVYDLLRSMLETAVEDGIIEANPCTIKGGSATRTGIRVTPPTDAELDVLMATINPRYRALIAIAAGAGLRWGEATALRTHDVAIERDDEGQLICVRVLIAEGVIYTPETGRIRKPTKNDLVRTVSIFGEDAQIIAERVEEVGTGLLYSSVRDETQPLSGSTFNRHWDAARIAAGRPDLHFHALRHYAGTRYAQAGATMKETMARLGHTTTSAAMRYQHAGTRDDELAARVAR